MPKPIAFNVRLEPTEENESLLKAFDEKARLAGFSREKFVLELMRREVGDFNPSLILGYIELSNSELDQDDDCPECNTPFGNGGVFIGFTPIGHFGPLCRRCALG